MAETKRIEISAQLVYEDPDLALGWLETAFGLQTRMVVRDDAQRLVYAEIGLGDSAVGIGPERPLVRSPKNAGGATQSLLVRLFEDIDAHCAQARAGGATIVREPERSSSVTAAMTPPIMKGTCGHSISAWPTAAMLRPWVGA